ncbi:MAG TPA: hypothetical protein PKC29_03790 [Thermodesulfobacteriota bacterium]|nr:hypothetical protein [Thermodesulfobacteriota bacterium]
MKDLAIMAIAILAIVAVANTKQMDVQSGFGGVQVVNLAEADSLREGLPAYADAESGDEPEISQYDDTTAYTDDGDAYEAIDEGSLRTAVLK